jgi:hypothetical protein
MIQQHQAAFDKVFQGLDLFVLHDPTRYRQRKMATVQPTSIIRREGCQDVCRPGSEQRPHGGHRLRRDFEATCELAVLDPLLLNVQREGFPARKAAVVAAGHAGRTQQIQDGIRRLFGQRAASG